MGVSFDLSGHRPITFAEDVDDGSFDVSRYDLLLVRNGIVVASLGRDAKYTVGSRMPTELPQQNVTHLPCAVVVGRRLLLCYDDLHPATGLRLVLVLSEQVPAAVRVLHHVLSDRVVLALPGDKDAVGGLRRSDEKTYVFLSRLLSRMRSVLHGAAGEHRVTNRSVLYGLLRARMHAICDLLLPEAADTFDGGDLLPMPLLGTVAVAPMTALLLCAVMGVCCLRAVDAPVHVSEVENDRSFLPELRIAMAGAGVVCNALPSPWMEARALACRCDMLFDVFVEADGAHMRLCPLCSGRTEAYALRASHTVLEDAIAQAPCDVLRWCISLTFLG
jgi:hypothetical protein